jgi:ABC-2 type transport system permease protein
LLTIPVWISVNYLGEPDNGAIVAAYLGSWLMAGAFLAVSGAVSAATKNQVIAFILSVVLCFVLMMTGHPMVLDFVRGFLPAAGVDAVASISVISHFDMLQKGVIDFRDLVYFGGLIGLALYITSIIIETKKAD